MFLTLSRYFHTLRYLSIHQVTGRLWYALRKRVRAIRVPSVPDNLNAHGLEPTVPFVDHEPWNTAEHLNAGRFTFLNRTENLGWPPNWSDDRQPLLWRFNLHYLHFLQVLAPDEREFVFRDWIQKNPVGAAVAWHPYPTSIRLSLCFKTGGWSPVVDYSLYTQAGVLFRSLESYHPGNHYLENARALVLAGKYFSGDGESVRWLEKGLDILRKELPRQVLDDGGYFERSPMYHALVLELVCDVLNVLDHDHPEVAFYEGLVRRMAVFLNSVTHPDGNIALINDSTHEIAPLTAVLIRYASALIGTEIGSALRFDDTGYYVSRSKDSFFFLKGGKIGPDELPAHAHADIFSFEWSVAGLPFITDTGVSEYAAGVHRDYERSTRAHNTVTIDRQNQAECWKSFRVARRFAPERVSFEDLEEGFQFSGEFDGYAKLIGDRLLHHRRVKADWNNRNLTVTDRVTGTASHLVESRFHFHPDVVVSRKNPGFEASFRGISVKILPGDVEARLESGWYCPQFGKREPRTVLVLSSRRLPCELQCRFIWKNIEE